MKSLLNKTIIPFIRYIKRNTNTDKATRVLDEVSRRIARSTADYIEENMTSAIIFQRRKSLWDYVFQKSSLEGLILEFGVSEGTSINYFSKLTTQTIYGFDSFEGLKEDWAGSGLLKGHFSREGEIPKVSENVSLIKGWFDESLPKFLDSYNDQLKIAHIDGDTYEAAKIVLEHLSPRIKKGTIIIFDEYFGYLGWKNGEYKAFQELVASQNITYRYLGFSENSVAVKIIQSNSKRILDT